MKSKTFWMIGGIVVFAVFLGILGNNSNNSNNQVQTSPTSNQVSDVQNTPAPNPPSTEPTKPTKPIAGPEKLAPVPETPTAPQQITPVVPAPTPTEINYSQFQDVDFEIYKANPNQYNGSNIAVLGMLDDVFLPSNGSNPNYIETINPADMTQQKIIEIEVGNQNNYSAAVNRLQLGESSAVFIKTYGVGTRSRQFTLTNGQTIYLPVIIAKRIDRCSHGIFQTTMVAGSKLSDVFSCTSWQTIFSNTY